MVRHLAAVWAQPGLCGCTGATFTVQVGVGIGVTFGMVVGVETGAVGLGPGVMSATDCSIH